MPSEFLAALERPNDERREAADRAEAARTHSDDKLANPGDYECPECKHITLRRTATKCTRGLWCGSGLPERLGWTDPERASGGHNRGEQRGDKHHPGGRRKKAGIERHVVS